MRCTSARATCLWPSFLGNPPINYLEGAIETECGVPFIFAVAASASRSLPGCCPPPARARMSSSVSARRMSPALWHHLMGPYCEASSIPVLPIGSDRFLGLKIEGLDSLCVRVDKQSHHRQGESVAFDLAPDRPSCIRPDEAA